MFVDVCVCCIFFGYGKKVQITVKMHLEWTNRLKEMYKMGKSTFRLILCLYFFL